MSGLTQQNDLSFGANSESANREKIEQFLDVVLEKTDTYAVMDWANTSHTIYVELKSRRIRHDQYPTAIIGLNKVEFCNDPAKSYYFCFSYLDGLYYIKYDPALFATFQTNHNFNRSDRDDCANYTQRIVYIPVEHLIRFP